MLTQLLHEGSITLHLEAPNREAALAELVASLPVSSLTSPEKVQVLDLVLQREFFGTTAVGEGVAFPHCFFDQISSPLMCLGISRKGIAFSSLDGELVHFILLMVFPDFYRESSERLIVLKEAATIFRDRFLKERLKISETVEEAYEIFIREAHHLADQTLRLRTSA